MVQDSKSLLPRGTSRTLVQRPVFNCPLRVHAPVLSCVVLSVWVHGRWVGHPLREASEVGSLSQLPFWEDAWSPSPTVPQVPGVSGQKAADGWLGLQHQGSLAGILPPPPFLSLKFKIYLERRKTRIAFGGRGTWTQPHQWESDLVFTFPFKRTLGGKGQGTFKNERCVCVPACSKALWGIRGMESNSCP